MSHKRAGILLDMAPPIDYFPFHPSSFIPHPYLSFVFIRPICVIVISLIVICVIIKPKVAQVKVGLDVKRLVVCRKSKLTRMGV